MDSAAKKKGQPIKHQEGAAVARINLRLPVPIKEKIDRNGGTSWVVGLVRNAEELDKAG